MPVRKSKTRSWSVPGASGHKEKPSPDLELPAPRQRRIMKTGQQGGRRARARKPPTGASAGCMDTAFMMPLVTVRDVCIMLTTRGGGDTGQR